jgi:tRNA pseudouridine38-40 synthase
MRWRLVVEYRGTDFVGWQVQPNGRSVQQVLEDGLASFLGERVHVSASGRTDAGVHALGQVVSFETTVQRPAKAMRDGLNTRLPADVACVSAETVADDFDPRRWARRKTYRYTWLVRRARSPLRDDRVCHARHGLDVEAMAQAARALVGTHDFASFRAVGCASTHAVRTIEDARVYAEGDLIHLEVVGNGFLRHMIRIVAGTLAEVGRGRRSPAEFAAVIAARQREAAGPTAPAKGLTLVSVVYGDGPPEWHRDG